jgi:hypothetical protein
MGFNWLYLNPLHYPGFLPRFECAGDNDIHIQPDMFGRQIRQPFEPPVGPSPLHSVERLLPSRQPTSLRA